MRFRGHFARRRRVSLLNPAHDTKLPNRLGTDPDSLLNLKPLCDAAIRPDRLPHRGDFIPPFFETALQGNGMSFESHHLCIRKPLVMALVKILAEPCQHPCQAAWQAPCQLLFSPLTLPCHVPCFFLTRSVRALCLVAGRTPLWDVRQSGASPSTAFASIQN